MGYYEKLEYSEAQDARDYEKFIGKPDPEMDKWHREFHQALKDMGFDEESVIDIEENAGLKPDYSIDPIDYADGLYFCECGCVCDYTEKKCPDCGEPAVIGITRVKYPSGNPE